jgi:hypothetical protein
VDTGWRSRMSSWDNLSTIAEDDTLELKEFSEIMV